MNAVRPVKCPTCGRLGDWFATSYGPFCSRRCKLVDLGRWFREEHRISDSLRSDDVSGADAIETGDEFPSGEES